MQHYSYFNQMVSNPIKKFGFAGKGGEAFQVLHKQVLDKVLLRRTKEERHADLQLPPMIVVKSEREPGAAEKDFYQAVYTQSRLKFDNFAQQGTLLHNYAHIFELLTKLRQACDHPWLLTRRLEGSPLPEISKRSKGVCGCCHEDISTSDPRGSAACGHVFHRDCIDQFIASAPILPLGGAGVGCPTCYVPLTVTFEDGQEDDDNDEDDGNGNRDQTHKPTSSRNSGILTGVSNSNFQTSTKLEMLADGIAKIPQTDKILVFSQFTRMLELAEFRLRQDGVGCARLTGAQTMTQRSNIILSFHRDPNLRVLLISLKAGGEGVNLQIANNIFLLDPWWNPAAELQAIQRAHRIGQTKPVNAVRLIAKGTIEERILSLQEKKQLVFDGTIGQSDGALTKLTHEDLAFLFQS